VAGTGEQRLPLLSRLIGARRRPRPAVRVHRARIGRVSCLEAEIAVPVARWAGVANALAALVAESAAAHATLVRIGVVAGEPPVIAAFRPRRDVVALQVRDALTAGVTHRRPHLWLALPAGVWAASAVDPDAPFEPSSAAIAAIVTSGMASVALLTDAAPHRGGVLLRVVLYATPGGVRSSLRAARRALAPPLG